jgi:hypothetical protein
MKEAKEFFIYLMILSAEKDTVSNETHSKKL